MTGERPESARPSDPFTMGLAKIGNPPNSFQNE
jgi:hypothetical protein